MGSLPETSNSSPSTALVQEFQQTVTANPFIPIEPTRRQALFLASLTPEILYGGAAGGGKSVALLMAALQYVDRTGYNAILLRRTFADLNLPEALIPLSHQWLQGSAASWDGQKYQWRFPSGAVLQFGYLETEIDKYRYQGAAFGFIGFDELTQFSESQYRYLFSRLRKKEDAQYPLRMRAASNPGGSGHEWVKGRFVAKDGNTLTRAFIPARLEDNPYLDRAAYEQSLAELDPITRKQLRHGDWNVRPDAGVFKSEWFRYWQPSDGFYLLGREQRAVAIESCNRFIAADIAGTERAKGTDPDWTVIQVWDCSPTGDMILVDQKRIQAEIPDVETALVELSRRFDVPYAVVEKNGIGLGVVQTAKRRGLAVKPVVAKGSKYARSQTAQIRMEAGGVYFPIGAPWLEELEAELLTFPTLGVHDDQVDAFSHAARHAQRLVSAIPGEGDTETSPVAAEIFEREQRKQERIEAFDDERMWTEVG